MSREQNNITMAPLPEYLLIDKESNENLGGYPHDAMRFFEINAREEKESQSNDTGPHIVIIKGDSTLDNGAWLRNSYEQDNNGKYITLNIKREVNKREEGINYIPILPSKYKNNMFFNQKTVKNKKKKIITTEAIGKAFRRITSETQDENKTWTIVTRETTIEIETTDQIHKGKKVTESNGDYTQKITRKKINIKDTIPYQIIKALADKNDDQHHQLYHLGIDGSVTKEVSEKKVSKDNQRMNGIFPELMKFQYSQDYHPYPVNQSDACQKIIKNNSSKNPYVTVIVGMGGNNFRVPFVRIGNILGGDFKEIPYHSFFHTSSLPSFKQCDQLINKIKTQIIEDFKYELKNLDQAAVDQVIITTQYYPRMDSELYLPFYLAARSKHLCKKGDVSYYVKECFESLYKDLIKEIQTLQKDTFKNIKSVKIVKVTETMNPWSKEHYPQGTAIEPNKIAGGITAGNIADAIQN
jgi:hypothetical protein